MKHFCTKCGNELGVGTAFCDNCGAPIKNVTVAEATDISRPLDATVNGGSKPRPGRGRGLVVIVGSVAIAIAVTIGGVWWVAFGNLDRNRAATTEKPSAETPTRNDDARSIVDRLAFSTDRELNRETAAALMGKAYAQHLASSCTLHSVLSKKPEFAELTGEPICSADFVVTGIQKISETEARAEAKRVTHAKAQL